MAEYASIKDFLNDFVDKTKEARESAEALKKESSDFDRWMANRLKDAAQQEKKRLNEIRREIDAINEKQEQYWEASHRAREAVLLQAAKAMTSLAVPLREFKSLLDTLKYTSAAEDLIV